MIPFILDNAGTIAVALGLAAVVIAVIRVLRRDRKQGRSLCGGSCGHCPMAGSCHKSL